MMLMYTTAKFASVWTTILKIRVIFVHQTLTKHALFILNHVIGKSSPIPKSGQIVITFEIPVKTQ